MAAHVSRGGQVRARPRIWLGVILLTVGLVGHLLAANAEGGRAIHYRHHIFGFVLLSVVSGILLAGLGRLFWRGRPDLTLLILGGLQTIFGLLIYAMFSNR
jgi:hypothetical protein